MNLARRVYSIAGIYGLIVVLPLFAGASRFSQKNPPPLTHPEFYWGFAGVTLAWQVAFLIIARDPVRYRPLMPATFLEKLIFGIATVALYVAGEASVTFFGAAIVDLVLGAFFVLAWFKTGEE
jgi:hypothetical protein